MSDTKRVVLLAEDDPGYRELSARALRASGYPADVHVANDGEEAIDFLFRRGAHTDPDRAPRPDLVILDLEMPKLNGMAVLDAIRGHPDLCMIPVVLMTNSDRDEDVKRGYGSGCNTFITKPRDVDEFLKAVGSLCPYWFETVVLPPREERH